MEEKRLKDLLEVLNSMKELELLMAEFYRVVGANWKDEAEFFERLQFEEIKHSKNIDTLIEIVSKNPGIFTVGRSFSKIAVNTVSSGINESIQKVKEGIVNKEKMLFIARDLENSLIESRFFEIVRTDNLDYLNLIGNIATETKAHREFIENKIREIKRSR